MRWIYTYIRKRRGSDISKWVRLVCSTGHALLLRMRLKCTAHMAVFKFDFFPGSDDVLSTNTLTRSVTSTYFCDHSSRYPATKNPLSVTSYSVTTVWSSLSTMFSPSLLLQTEGIVGSTISQTTSKPCVSCPFLGEADPHLHSLSLLGKTSHGLCIGNTHERANVIQRTSVLHMSGYDIARLHRCPHLAQFTL